MLCLNFFFLPPFGTFMIAAPDNWIALFAFLITAVSAGQLSARAKRRAEEAESGKREIGRLYAELREAFRPRRISQDPIIVLSAKGEERTKVAALDLGADDFVTSRLASTTCSPACVRHCAARARKPKPNRSEQSSTPATFTSISSRGELLCAALNYISHRFMPYLHLLYLQGRSLFL